MWSPYHPFVTTSTTRRLSGQSKTAVARSPVSRGSRGLAEPLRRGVLLVDEPRGVRRLVGGEAVGLEPEAVLALEGSGQRGGDVVELGPVAERHLERRQGGERVARGGKERPEARRVDTEQDRAVLEEAPAVPPLGAADDLARIDLDLV